MGHARTLSVSLSGLDGTLVEVEADVSPGLPAFTLVGLPDSSTLQARERVRAATAHSGVPLAARRITVNMTPAWRPKRGSGFDLAIAMAVVDAQGDLLVHVPGDTVLLGELGLDGRVRPIPGVLPALLAARGLGISRAVVPQQNLTEARLVDGLEVDGAEDLTDLLHRFGADVPSSPVRQSLQLTAPRPGAMDRPGPAAPPDFADVLGQAQARRAAEVAAAGGHHLLLTGPPGAGKTMIASRIPGILPELEIDDSLTVSAIHSLGGRFDADDGLCRTPPFESPHHTSSTAAIVGGGSGLARPGAISRAHAGVLFLDEAPEFSSRVLEALREPLETGDITLHRARAVTRYPARFQLVLAANPCPCGQAFGKGAGCSCTAMQKRRYAARLSGPVLDRIDMRVQVGPVDIRRTSETEAEPTAVIAQRVAAARRRQRQRFAGLPWRTNAQLPGPRLRREFSPRLPERRLLDHAVAQGRLTLRGHDRVLRLAWTLADLDESDRPDAEHIGLALTLREGEPR
ncbi:Mg chelatase-like protein [Brachybacterium sp. P6-10-X1]|uniref:YifB family Mg chelatase-like AAA ATPase n=1 Tax=Brachybacterium sp. P6-10-X1 TaxID=1903186 RepID=UPI000971908C|nr:YifB family Mg chelatase-like AAA ATPase [Brachybacterium sp. P6-10-X1]APX34418.1 Mg chelatase-like protein [Brachybacterium sp. P6-10-X1]